VIALAAQRGGVGAVRAAALQPAVAEDVAGQQAAEPQPLLGLGAAVQQAVDGAEVGAQGLGGVGVDGGQLDHEADHLAHRGAGAAKGLGNAPGQQAGLGDAAHQRIGSSRVRSRSAAPAAISGSRARARACSTAASAAGGRPGRAARGGG
jgi:hypothetical protein